ncbi:hypothetical protein AB6A40_008770, partial [Gnathostoma spinigerum]
MALSGHVSLGLDIGTTSVKVCVIDSKGSKLVEDSIVHNAWIPNKNADVREQDPVKIIQVISDMLGKIKEECENVTIVTVTGQQHGVVLWNKQKLKSGEFCTSPLITWMDTRIPQKFVDSLPPWRHGKLDKGYGMVTLAWMKHEGLLDPRWNTCGTIMDMVTSYMAATDDTTISLQNAFTWGYCDWSGKWTVPDSLVPHSLLPTVRQPSDIVGKLVRGGLRSTVEVRITVALGDLQSTVFPLLDRNTAVINIGTSSQLCFCLPKTEVTQMTSSHGAIR